ncbi:MAG: amino acid ABC transporter substrate-binding protein, partial [Deltaproteobacteria bacterium]|nr:amino acid ABC transporter substrate-binding protein [Deltaproteobacteria bacterium]
CKKEGYRKEVEFLTHWLKKKQVNEIAVLYNADDVYSNDIYNNFSRKIKDEKIEIVFSDIFKSGERSFYSRLKIIESLNPEAIIFLGSYEERIAFLEDISQRSKLDFWKSRLDKIKWIE